MNLYHPDGNDAPFGPTDLEWLYRRQDVDGVNLDSRLAHLAPISFDASPDAQTRRRLFSVEAWDRIDYAFANDNPDNVRRRSSRRRRPGRRRGTYNARFTNTASASLAQPARRWRRRASSTAAGGST